MMPSVVGIRFKRAGRIYYYDPANTELEVNDLVVVPTPQGLDIGWVVIAPKQVLASDLTEPLKPVLRKAEAKDLEQSEARKRQEREALATTAGKVAHYNLPMKLLRAEYSLDGSSLTFYFGAERRVDFRELARDLAATFKTRIELRQVGPRDEVRLFGGIGRCGRPLCCATCFADFAIVSIKMAKEQNLPLSPPKISGLCGRLLCCLSFESEFYAMMREKLPSPDSEVKTPLGLGRVVATNPVKETVMVQLESQAIVEIPLSQITFPQGGP